MDKKKAADNKSVKSKSKEPKSKSKDKIEEGSKKTPKDKSQKSQKSQKSESKQDLDKSQVSDVLPPPVVTVSCIHHKFPFIYFCQTCQQLVCNQCIVFGPHNNHLHRILKITDAYRSRVFYLSEAIRSNLVEKRDKIIAQLHRIEYRVEEIRFVKNIIERDIRSEYGGYLERLKSSQGSKIAILSHEMSIQQRDVDSINELGNKFFELTNLDVDADKQICRFLTKSKKMYEAIEYHLNKPDRELPQMNVNDLPQEVEQNRTEVKKALSSREILQFKDELIWQLIQESKIQSDRIKKDLQAKADNMIRSLSDEAQDLHQHLTSYQLVCHYCLVALDPSTVNDKCMKNTAASQPSESRMTVEVPPQTHNGKGRHFFSRPSAQYLKLHKQTVKN